MASQTIDDSINDDICGLPASECGFTLSRINQIIQNAFNQSQPPKNVRGKRIDEGAGYMAIIARLCIEWPSDAAKTHLPTQAIIKSPTPHKLMAHFKEMNGGKESDTTSFSKILQIMHNRECDIYEKIAPKLGQERYTRLVDIPMPMLYAHEPYTDKSAGLLLMEDLSDHAEVPDFTIGLPLHHTLDTLHALAKFHAFAYQNESMFDPKLYSHFEPEAFEDFMNSFWSTPAYYRKQFGDLFTFSDDQLRRLISLESVMKIFDPSQSEYVPILTQGDMWTNNFLFERNPIDKSKPALVGLIDWQVSHRGLVTEDIAHLIAYSLDPELRRSRLTQLLDAYYAQFVSSLTLNTCDKSTGHDSNNNNNSLQVNVPFTRQQLTELYNRVYPMNAFFAMGHIALMLQSAYLTKPAQNRIYLVKRVVANIEDALVMLDNTSTEGVN